MFIPLFKPSGELSAKETRALLWISRIWMSLTDMLDQSQHILRDQWRTSSPLRRFPRLQTSSIRSLQCSQPNRSTNEHISHQYASCRIIHTTTPYPQTFPARKAESRQVMIDEIECLTISRQISAKSLFWVCSWLFSNFSRHLIQNGYKTWLFANVFSPWSSSGRMSCTAARNLQKSTEGYLWDGPSSVYIR